MRKLLLACSFVFSVFVFTGEVVAQSTAITPNNHHSYRGARYASEGMPTRHVTLPATFPSSPLSELVSVPGAVDMGVTGKWHDQSNGGPLHRIQVDPSNPSNIHAVIMSAFGVTESDTTSADLVPQRRVYYVFSSDGGATWSAPKSVSATRAGYQSILIMQRNGVGVPVIALHRFDEGTTDVTCALYIEKGAPGAGDFQEIPASRFTYNDEEQNIIWPAITLSNDGTKILMIASISYPPGGAPDFLQFGTFTLNETKDNATWSGWQEGPAPNDAFSITVGGDYAIHVAPSGKVGVMWTNASSDDLGLYYAESTDNGATWGNAENVYFSVETNDAEPDEGVPYMIRAGSGSDFVFDGETPMAVFAGYYEAFKSDNSRPYIPSSGSLLFWRKGEGVKYLVAQSAYNTHELGDPMFPGDFLHSWLASSIVNPEPVISNPVFAQSPESSKFSVYFEAWTQDDTAEVGEILSDPDHTGEAFKSIYRMHSLDGGMTWTAPEGFQVNPSETPVENRLDFRFPNTSSWNPMVDGQVQVSTMFAVDSTAGLHGDTEGGGDPGWSDVYWFYKKDEFAKARKTATPSFSLEQNYPNPVVSGNRSTIPLSLVNTEYVTITITDVMGRELATVYTGQLSGGNHELAFSTQAMTPGMYQYIVQTGDVTLARSFTVVK